MNKAITDGLVLMPLPFKAGLGVWSSEDGTPGSNTYAGSGTGVFVAADQDFGGCLEIQKTQATQKLRYMGETPILPGCYLRITARVKAVAGPMPSVRIAAWAGKAGGGQATEPTTTGPAVALDTYGETVTIQAIVGTGDRTGVDMVWQEAAYGHFGINLTGANGGLVRIDDIQVEDITVAFHRKLMAMVDVRDYGATGDGSTDDAAAFLAADAAAQGREILVPDGVFKLASDVTIQNRIRFEGTITQPRAKRFILQKDFNYATYVDAFKDEELAFRKAFQAMLNFADHESLDLCGRRISLTEPMDMQRCDPSQDGYEIRRVIRNGQIQPVPGPNWNTETTTSQATYNINTPTRLTNVANVADIAVGSLVSGSGVGREVYVKSRNVGAQRIDISRPLYDAQGTQEFTFRRYKYLLDFSGYDKFSQFILDDIEFQCAGEASGIMLATDGLTFHLRDCFINKPKDRGLTSPGYGCQGMMIDRCQFISNEQSLRVQDRTTIAFNANANDVKVRANRVSKFKHFCVLTGTGSLISGNHWFHGDDESDGARRGGVVITTANCRSIITGNYIDNNSIEWTNEHEAEPEFNNQFSFGGLTITGNIFTTIDVASGFSYIVIKPYGPGHYVQGLAVTGNVFRCIGGNIKRVEDINTSIADLDMTRMRQITFSGNTFNGVNDPCYNPAYIEHDQTSASGTWTVNTDPYLPFRGRARNVEAIQPEGRLRTAGGSTVYASPYVEPEKGAGGRSVEVHWPQNLRGKVRMTVRMDNPT